MSRLSSKDVEFIYAVTELFRDPRTHALGDHQLSRLAKRKGIKPVFETFRWAMQDLAEKEKERRIIEDAIRLLITGLTTNTKEE